MSLNLPETATREKGREMKVLSAPLSDSGSDRYEKVSPSITPGQAHTRSRRKQSLPLAGRSGVEFSFVPEQAALARGFISARPTAPRPDSVTGTRPSGAEEDGEGGY